MSRDMYFQAVNKVDEEIIITKLKEYIDSYRSGKGIPKELRSYFEEIVLSNSDENDSEIKYKELPTCNTESYYISLKDLPKDTVGILIERDC